MDPLSGFLYEAARRRFVFGLWDCGHFCGAWFHRRRGIDPAARWRGAYDDAEGLAALLESRGGIVAHFDAALCEAGAAPAAADPQRGDIVVAATAEGLAGGIVTGTMIAFVAGRGLILRHRALVPVQAAWSV